MRINTKAMKVAILSMQQIKNYGSFLQAFSLKKNIESLGHTCEFINIIPGEQLEGYKTSCFYNIKLLFQRLWGWDFPNDICFSESFSKRVPTLFGSKKRNKYKTL